MLIFNRVTRLPELQEISFNIKRGEFVTIFTPQPEGLILIRKLIMGKENPDRGLIRLLNYSPHKEVIKYELGVVYQQNIFLPDRTIEENFKFIIEARGLKTAYMKSRVKKIMQVVDLKSCLQYRPQELLGHQLVRVNIAGALLCYPSLLVLEDSFQQLDELNRRSLMGLLARINRLGITVIYLSSGEELLKNSYSDRIICLNKKEVEGHYLQHS